MIRTLVTNDDGVAAPGIGPLARAMVDLGLDVVVAAPSSDWSGSGAAIGPVHTGEGIRVSAATIAGVDVPVHAVDGPPGLAVMAARLGGFGAPPELVVSGINPGCNTGRAVMHSGTVGAALTAANFGVRGLAVSIDVGEPSHLDTAAAVAAAAVEWLRRQPEQTVLNVNVPNVAAAQLRGVRNAALAPFGTVQAAMVSNDEGMLQLELRATESELDPDTDTALVAAGWVAVTRLVGVRAADGEPASGDPAGTIASALGIA
jgi:5'-nucleotidase